MVFQSSTNECLGLYSFQSSLLSNMNWVKRPKVDQLPILFLVQSMNRVRYISTR